MSEGLTGFRLSGSRPGESTGWRARTTSVRLRETPPENEYLIISERLERSRPSSMPSVKRTGLARLRDPTAVPLLTASSVIWAVRSASRMDHSLPRRGCGSTRIEPSVRSQELREGIPPGGHGGQAEFLISGRVEDTVGG